MTARPCIGCGAVIDAGTRCPDCTPTEPSAHTRGYDAAWTRLSRRARRLQPFCSDCGATNDLQADHTPEAWRRKAAGLSIRLQDVDVVCGPCNRARGAARPGTHRADERPPAGQPGPSTRGRDPHRAPERPVGKAQSPSHTPGGYL